MTAKEVWEKMREDCAQNVWSSMRGYQCTASGDTAPCAFDSCPLLKEKE